MDIDRRHGCFRAARLLPLLLFVGCSTLEQQYDMFLAGSGETALETPPALPPDLPTATVVMVASGEQPVSAPLPLHEIVYIQQALEMTGLDSRFRRMKLELFRPLEAGNHRLDIRYDRDEHRVASEYDYALRPGDRLVVTEDTSTVLDDMLGSLAGPFN